MIIGLYVCLSIDTCMDDGNWSIYTSIYTCNPQPLDRFLGGGCMDDENKSIYTSINYQNTFAITIIKYSSTLLLKIL